VLSKQAGLLAISVIIISMPSRLQGNQWLSLLWLCCYSGGTASALNRTSLLSLADMRRISGQAPVSVIRFWANIMVPY